MRFGVLGSLTVEERGADVQAPPGMLRRLLAALLSRAGEPVPVNDLVDALWPDRPPINAAKTIQIYVHRLRRQLRDPERIRRRPTGYAIVLSPGELDAQTFVEHVQQAREARTAGRLERAAEQLRRALHLWRGAPYEDLADCAFIRPEVQRLNEWRARALEDRAAVELDQGRHAELIPELSGRVAEYPHRERLCGLLMLAMYRSGRQADALQAYHRLREHLADEFGIDPGQPLTELYTAILRNMPAIGPGQAPWPVTAEAGPTVARAIAAGPVPAELGPDVANFTGRSTHLARLDGLLDSAGAASPPVTSILAIVGTAGVGKTALAVHWSHRVRHRFPDGQLYVNLQGHAPGRPARPIDALAQFLRALGVPAANVPVRLDEAAGMYRSLLADRRTLVVLDNAASADQVRPLLPGSPGCLVLVTSRDRLGGLNARDGAHRITLDVFTPDEATTLLTRLLGPDRVRAEPDATAHLARLCAHLPLALRIAAANLIDRPHHTIASDAAHLCTGNRLAALQVDGDRDTAVRATLDLSYARLAPDARRLFRLLGLVPGPDVTAEAAAALIDNTTGNAQRLLETLAGAHLIDQRAAGRFAFHDLLRVYAAERAHLDDRDADRSAAVDRLYSHYLRSVDAAARLLYAGALRLPLPAATSTGRQAAFDDHAHASVWLDAERPNLVAAVVHTADHGPRSTAWLLADVLRTYFYLRMYAVDWLAVARAGLAAAEADGQLQAQAAGQLSLAQLHRRRGAFRTAIDHYERALALAEETDWTDGQASALSHLGAAHFESGHPVEAIAHFNRALSLAEQSGWLGGQAVALASLGAAHWELGRLQCSFDHQVRALALHRRIGSHDGETIDLGNLGEVLHARGEFDRAVDLHTRALDLRRQVGNRAAEAGSLLHLAAVHRDAGRYDRALDLASTAVDLAREVGYPRVESEALNVLGTVHRCLGDPHRAIELHQRALRLARDVGGRYPQTEAAIDLATALRCAGQFGNALTHAHQALAIASEAGYRLLEGQALTVLAAVHLDRDDIETAVSYANQARAVHCETGHRLGLARTHAVLGEALNRAGQPTAGAHQVRARAIFSEIGAAEAAEGRCPRPTAPVQPAGGPAVATIEGEYLSSGS